jgi:hypothetical protein
VLVVMPTMPVQALPAVSSVAPPWEAPTAELAALSSAPVPRVAAARPAPAATLGAPSNEAPGHLRVTATPEAVIEVDGRVRGATPVADLALAPGSHLVRLTCAPLGEAVSQTLRIEPGETLSVAGDFTGARGRIFVRRTPVNP